MCACLVFIFDNEPKLDLLHVTDRQKCGSGLWSTVYIIHDFAPAAKFLRLLPGTQSEHVHPCLTRMLLDVFVSLHLISELSIQQGSLATCIGSPVSYAVRIISPTTTEYPPTYRFCCCCSFTCSYSSYTAVFVFRLLLFTLSSLKPPKTVAEGHFLCVKNIILENGPFSIIIPDQSSYVIKNVPFLGRHFS